MPLPSLPSARQFWASAALSVSLLGLSACESHSHRGRGYAGGEAHAPRIALRATGNYFDRQVLAIATLTNGFGGRIGPDGDSGSGGGHHGGMGGGGMGYHGGMGGGGRHGEGMRGGEDMGNSDRGGESAPSSMGRLASHEPPLTLRVRLENQGKTDLNIEIRDIESDLGNFVPDPDHVLLAPGQAVELEPMISRLGVTEANIPLKLVLRYAGHDEDQTLTLQPITPAPATPTPAVPTSKS